MEASTAEQAAASATAQADGGAATPTSESDTLAYLVPHAVAQFGPSPAVRYKHDGTWHDVSYAQLGEIVQETALGLIDLGIEPGERICILANTRPEWSYADLAATAVGAVVVPIYQTNSAEECHWVIADSGACAIVCEDESQLAKVAAVRERLPELRTVIVIDPPATADGGGRTATVGSPLAAVTLAEVRERGRNREPAELERRRSAVRPADPYTFIYTSGTTGPPKGCVLSHGNYAAMMNMIREVGHIEADEVIYLYLPLAHSYALADPARGLRTRRDARVLRRRHQADRAGADGGQADLPALGAARLREGLRTRAGRDPGPGTRGAGARAGRGRARREGARPDGRRRAGPGGAAGALRPGRGEAVQERPRNLRRTRAARDERRGADRQRDPRVLLGRRRAGAGGLRDDRDGDRRDDLDDRGPQVRHRRAPAAGRRAEDRPRRRATRSRAPTSSRATTTKPTRASARSRTAGCTPATSARSTRTDTSRSWAARRTSSSPRAART